MIFTNKYGTTLAPLDMTEGTVQDMLQVAEDGPEVEEGDFRSSKRLPSGVTLGEKIL